jgi:CxxC motif-containing protein (DUF1111 family)
MKHKIIAAILSISLFILIISSCKKLLPPLPVANEVIDGPLDNLTGEQLKIHLSGAEEFDEVYSIENGLGPAFVSTSCGSCHAGVGKGHPFTTLTRFGQSDTLGNTFLQQGAPQLQHRTLPSYIPETIPSGASFTKLTAPINAGLGFLDLVSDADLIAFSDPLDIDGDGISGVPNWNTIPSYVIPRANALTHNNKYICRFGKKGSTYDLLQQTAVAFNQDMGINSAFEPIDNYSQLKVDPEVGNSNINNVVFYLKTIQQPLQRKENDISIQKGKQLFQSINCTGCHKETLKTNYSVIEPLSNKEFHPYTDLLLHDMGNSLNDNYTEGSALPSEWRTPALWGLGLSPISQGGEFYLMHDGRARSISEAINMHDGEATKSKEKFNQLTQQEKEDVLEFLNSL